MSNDYRERIQKLSEQTFAEGKLEVYKASSTALLFRFEGTLKENAGRWLARQLYNLPPNIQSAFIDARDLENYTTSFRKESLKGFLSKNDQLKKIHFYTELGLAKMGVQITALVLKQIVTYQSAKLFDQKLASL